MLGGADMRRHARSAPSKCHLRLRNELFPACRGIDTQWAVTWCPARADSDLFVPAV